MAAACSATSCCWPAQRSQHRARRSAPLCPGAAGTGGHADRDPGGPVAAGRPGGPMAGGLRVEGHGRGHHAKDRTSQQPEALVRQVARDLHRRNPACWWWSSTVRGTHHPAGGSARASSTARSSTSLTAEEVAVAEPAGRGESSSQVIQIGSSRSLVLTRPGHPRPRRAHSLGHLPHGARLVAQQLPGGSMANTGKVMASTAVPRKNPHRGGAGRGLRRGPAPRPSTALDGPARLRCPRPAGRVPPPRRHPTASPWRPLEDIELRITAVQFHPEVGHTPHGRAVADGFLPGVAEASAPAWTADEVIDRRVEAVGAPVGNTRVIPSLSGWGRLRTVARPWGCGHRPSAVRRCRRHWSPAARTKGASVVEAIPAPPGHRTPSTWTPAPYFERLDG